MPKLTIKKSLADYGQTHVRTDPNYLKATSISSEAHTFNAAHKETTRQIDKTSHCTF